MSGFSDAEIIQIGYDFQSTKYYLVAATAVLFYDWILTLPAEIECAWNNRKTPVSCLFLLNRYISLGFGVITLISYFSPLWTFDVYVRCNRYAVTQFVHTLVTFTIAETFLTFRVYVLTGKNRYLTGLLALHIVTQAGLALYILGQGGGGAIQLYPDLSKIDAYHICMLFPAKKTLRLDTAYLCLALSFDIVVFVITLFVTIRSAATSPSHELFQVIQRDGIIYFTVIFSSTLVWTILTLRARIGLRLINAEPDTIFTAVMINRLYLSLKKAGRNRETWMARVNVGNDVALQVVISQHTVRDV